MQKVKSQIYFLCKKKKGGGREESEILGNFIREDNLNYNQKH